MRARHGLLGLLLSGLHACAGLGSVDRELAQQLAEGGRGPTRVEIDRAGGIVTVAWPVAEHDVPDRALFAARAIQPDGDGSELEREKGPWGEGWRLTTRYGDRQRTVLVSDAGDVLHKTWDVPRAEAPAELLATAVNRCLGAVERVAVSQGPGPGAGWIVTTQAPDGRRRLWVTHADGRAWSQTEVGAVLRVSR
jgi:hypothetical protein